MTDEKIIIDKIKWWVYENSSGYRETQPLCPVHNLRLYPVDDIFSTAINYQRMSHTLKCAECKELHKIPRGLAEERGYVVDKIDAKFFRTVKFINFDDMALPIAEETVKSKDGKYFVTSLLTESKLGLRLVIYAGKRRGSEKTQIFVEPDIKRLAFDQKDLHPTDIFTKVEAFFSDGSKQTIEK